MHAVIISIRLIKAKNNKLTHCQLCETIPRENTNTLFMMWIKPCSPIMQVAIIIIIIP